MIKQLYRFLNPKFQTLFSDYNVIMKPRYGHEKSAHKELLSIIDKNHEEYSDLINKALAYKENIWTIQDMELELAPMWDHQNLKGVKQHGGSYWIKIN